MGMVSGCRSFKEYTGCECQRMRPTPVPEADVTQRSANTFHFGDDRPTRLVFPITPRLHVIAPVDICDVRVTRQGTYGANGFERKRQFQRTRPWTTSADVNALGLR